MENMNKLLQAIRDGKMQSFTVEDTSMRPKSSGGLVDKVTEAVYNAAGKAVKEMETKDTEDTEDTEEVKYTYKPGDTFGQVLLNLGLSDTDNLWGEGGNVDYYTNQLRNQGIWGDIPVGSTITLRKRK